MEFLDFFTDGYKPRGTHFRFAYSYYLDTKYRITHIKDYKLNPKEEKLAETKLQQDLQEAANCLLDSEVVHPDLTDDMKKIVSKYKPTGLACIIRCSADDFILMYTVAEDWGLDGRMFCYDGCRYILDPKALASAEEGRYSWIKVVKSIL